jgi:3-hydroxyacyl-[acyl-carrier-protein] dehydratase
MLFGNSFEFLLVTPMPTETIFSVGDNHPSLPGHFPGHPVVPGVVVLSHVFAELNRHLVGQSITGIHRMKFMRPILPQQKLRIEIAAVQANRLPFKCWLGDTLAVEGSVVVSGEQPPKASP